MTTYSYSEACRRHQNLQRCHEQDSATASALFAACRGEASPELDSYVEACQDLAPAEYARSLASGGCATAYAVARMFEHAAEARSATPFKRRELARQAWARFVGRAELADKVQYGLGFDESESWECTRNFDVRHNASAVIRIVEMAGRMFAKLQRDKAQQPVCAPEEIHDVEMGDNLRRLLPSELVHLGQPSEVLLLERLANRKCLQYALKGHEPVGRGPLVLAVDESGSMHGSRGEWSKAATVALVRSAWLDGRACSVVHWSSSVHVTELQPNDGAALLRAVEHWFGGGNSAQRALSCAADEIDRLAKAGQGGGDVVLITDGVEPIGRAHEQAIDRVAERNARLFTVAVECPIAADNILRSRASVYVPIGGAEVNEGAIGAMAKAVL